MRLVQTGQGPCEPLHMSLQLQTSWAAPRIPGCCYVCDADTNVQAAPFIINLDRYGRTVAICRVGATDLGERLLGRGLALDWPQYSSGKYSLNTILQRTALIE